MAQSMALSTLAGSTAVHSLARCATAARSSRAANSALCWAARSVARSVARSGLRWAAHWALRSSQAVHSELVSLVSLLHSLAARGSTRSQGERSACSSAETER